MFRASIRRTDSLENAGTGKTIYRKKTRELLMRLIFQMTSTGDFSDEAREVFLADSSLYSGDVSLDSPPGCIFDESAGESPDTAYFNWAFECIRDNLPEIDLIIEEASEGWALPRIGTAELAILRVAAAELLYIEGIDTGVSVNEAVILSKKYGTEKSAAFVNGVLGSVARHEA